MRSTMIPILILQAVPFILSSCQIHQSILPTKPASLMSTRIHADIPYTSERTMDIYAPTEGGSWPLVVAFHGGGTSKLSLRGLSESIAAMGSLVFVPNWRSQPPPIDAIAGGCEDAACAIRFARARAEQYGGSPARLIVIGHSAGGAVGATVTLAGDHFQGDCLEADEEAIADGFIGLDGAYDILEFVPKYLYQQGDPTEWSRITPFSYLDRSYYRSGVQFTLFVGLEEELLEHAERLQSGLSAMGYKASIVHLPDVGHMEMSMSREEVLNFVSEMLYPE